MDIPAPGTGTRRYLTIVIILVALNVSAGYLYMEGRSPADVTSLTMDRAPGGIVFIADPHLREENIDQTREIIRQINDLHPSVVLIGGDFTYDRNDLALQDVWSGLDAPVYAVLGNHDYLSGIGAAEILRKSQLVQKASLQAGRYNASCFYDSTTDAEYAGRLAEALNRSGVTVLRNEYRTLAINGRKLTLVGVDDCWAGMAAPPQVPKDDDAFVIYLIHEPECRANWDADLILSGHTHGGQVIPSGFERVISGGLVTLSGKITSGRTTTYITRGIGTSSPGVTLRATPPEIVYITPGKSTL